MPKVEHKNAPEVEQIAEELIEKYHRHLIDFDVKVRYVFASKSPKKNGKELWGDCKKITGINAYLSGDNGSSDPYFLITISEPIWDGLDNDQKVALVDHELCKTEATANQKEDSDGDEPVVKLSIRPYDVLGFSGNVRRHGAWQEEVKSFLEASKGKE